MIASDWKKLKADAAETLGEIDFERLTKDSFILAGAAMGILNYPVEGMPATPPESPVKLSEDTPEYYVEDELASAENYLRMGLTDMARDEAKHAGYWIEQLPTANRKHYAERLEKIEHLTGKPNATSGVLDDFSDILSRYDDTHSMADRDAMRDTLKQQLSEIERELVEMRHAVHDDACVQMFVDFRENLRLKI